MVSCNEYFMMLILFHFLFSLVDFNHDLTIRVEDEVEFEMVWELFGTTSLYLFLQEFDSRLRFRRKFFFEYLEFSCEILFFFGFWE